MSYFSLKLYQYEETLLLQTLPIYLLKHPFGNFHISCYKVKNFITQIHWSLLGKFLLFWRMSKCFYCFKILNYILHSLDYFSHYQLFFFWQICDWFKSQEPQKTCHITFHKEKTSAKVIGNQANICYLDCVPKVFKRDQFISVNSRFHEFMIWSLL